MKNKPPNMALTKEVASLESERSYKLTVEDREEYLFASVKGEGTGAAPYLEPIAEHCLRVACSAILIEKNTKEPFAVWDTFAVAPKLAAVGNPCMKIAVVEKGTEPLARRELSVMLGHNRGLDVHVFTDTSEAKQWLTKRRQNGHGHVKQSTQKGKT
jgi:hypothetical protein